MNRCPAFRNGSNDPRYSKTRPESMPEAPPALQPSIFSICPTNLAAVMPPLGYKHARSCNSKVEKIREGEFFWI